MQENRLQKYQLLVADLQSRYGSQLEISQQDFVDILTKLQALQPLINYQQQQIYAQIYNILKQTYTVNFSRAMELVEFITNKNKKQILEIDVIERLQQQGHVTVESCRLMQLLLQCKELNQSLKFMLISRFEQTDSISIEKFKKHIITLKEQLVQSRLSFINCYDLKRTIMTNGRGAQINIKQHFERIVDHFYTCFPSEEESKILKEFGEEFYTYYDENQEIKKEYQDVILQIKQRFKQQEQLLDKLQRESQQLNSENSLLSQQIIKLQSQIQSLILSEQAKSEYARDCTNLISAQRAELAFERDNYKYIQLECNTLREALNRILSNNTELEKDNNTLQQLVSKEQYSIEQSQLRKQLERTNKIVQQDNRVKQLLEKKIQEQNRKIEQLEFRLRKFEIHEHSQTNLREEGLSSIIYFQKIKQNQMDSKLQIVCDKILQKSRLSRSIVRQSVVSVVDQQSLQDITQLQTLLQLNKNKLSVWNDQYKMVQQLPNFKKKKEFVQSKLYCNIEQILYGQDYEGVRDKQQISEIIQVDKLNADFAQNRDSERLMFLSLRVKLLRQSGSQYIFTLAATAANLYFIQNIQKRSRDTIPIARIREIVLCENQHWLIIRYGNVNDLLLQTNKRIQLIKFILKVRQCMQKPLSVIRTRNEILVIKQDKKDYKITQFKRLLEPYKLVRQYWKMQCSVKIISPKYYSDRTYLLLLNESGFFVFKDQNIEIREHFILYLPLLPTLTIVDCDSNIKLDYQSKYAKQYYLQLPSAVLKKQLLEIVRKLQSQQNIYKISRFKQQVSTL